MEPMGIGFIRGLRFRMAWSFALAFRVLFRGSIGMPLWVDLPILRKKHSINKKKYGTVGPTKTAVWQV